MRLHEFCNIKVIVGLDKSNLSGVVGTAPLHVGTGQRVNKREEVATKSIGPVCSKGLTPCAWGYSHPALLKKGLRLDQCLVNKL